MFAKARVGSLQLFAALCFLATTAAAAGGAHSGCSCNELGRNAPVWRLNLRAKDPANWQVIEGGARGELVIQRNSGNFTVKGQGLRPDTEYALVRYEGNPPFGQLLARAVSDSRGELSSKGVWHDWSRKFWLVLGKDLQGKPGPLVPGAPDQLTQWHPTQYLFESEPLPARQ